MAQEFQGNAANNGDLARQIINLQAGGGATLTPAVAAQVQALVSGAGNRRRKLAIIGDSFSSPDGPTAWTDNCWWVHALAELQWPYEVIAVSCVVGRTTADMAAAFATEVTPYAPQEVWILAGQNDRGSVALAQAGLTALDSLIAYSKAAGAFRVVIGTPNDNTTPTTASRDALLTYIQGIYSRASGSGGFVEAADTAGAYRDISLSTGAITSSLQRGDNFHPNKTGARRMGAAFAFVAGKGVTWSRFGEVVAGPTDNRVNTSTSLQLAQNPTFLGTGGTATGSGAVSGTVPDLWTLNVPSGITVTTSIVTEYTPRQRRWLRLTFTGSAAGSGEVNLLRFVDMAASSLANGDSVKGRVALRQSGLSANFSGATVYANWYTAGFGAAGGAQCGGGSYGLAEMPASLEIIKETPKSAAGSNGQTATMLQTNIGIAFAAGAMSGYVDIGEPTYFKV